MGGLAGKWRSLEKLDLQEMVQPRKMDLWGIGVANRVKNLKQNCAIRAISATIAIKKKNGGGGAKSGSKDKKKIAG